MKKFINSYKFPLLLLSSVILGSLVGLFFKSSVVYLKPFGEIFLNMMYTVVVPLVFFTISSSIANMINLKRLGKILYTVFFVFFIMSAVAAIYMIVVTYIFNPVNASISLESGTSETINLSDQIVKALTVTDFNLILSRSNMLPLIVFSILFGIATSLTKSNTVKKFLDEASNINMKIVKIIMYYAPIGLGCYMAALIGTYGATIASGFLKTFIIYTLVCVFVYFVVYSIYALIGGGKIGLKKYWLNIITPTATALGTCSSAACIPVNSRAAKNIGVSSDIAETIVPLGTSFHKDGSIIGSAFKIMFLVYLFDTNPSVWLVLGVSLLVTLLITAVPIGGGTISEMMILTLMGFPVAALPILTVIATIIDAPATVLNVVGDTASSMLVSRMVDGKDKLAKE